MARLCVLCYEYTHGNLPLCLRHYIEFKDVVDLAIKENEEWLNELERITQKEYRTRIKQKGNFPLELDGEQIDRLE